MFEFNNNHIFTGYIKQLLASFNLPKYRVYTKENADYAAATGKEKNIIETILATKTNNNTNDTSTDHYVNHIRYMPYIKEDIIQYYAGIFNEQTGEVENLHWIDQGVKPSDPNYPQHPHHYEYGMYVPNYTKNLELRNNIYDSYTHEYLGDYLRFNRDYLGLDLMPLYNCFSNRICNNLKLAFDVPNKKHIEKKHVVFNANDTRYKIYMLPVKLFKDYTIAIDSSTPIELCCVVYGKYQDTREKFKDIPKLTYQCYSYINFGQPVIYKKVAELANNLENKKFDAELAQNEGDLKLLIKVPFNNKSSIVVLEGDYSGYGDYVIHKNEPTDQNTSTNIDNIFNINKENNYWVTNFEGPVILQDEIDDAGNTITERGGLGEDFIFKPITALQLLKINTGISYPFADRLVEYLTENVINNQDYIADDILRVQKVVSMNGIGNESSMYPYPKYGTAIPGAWENRLRPILYQYINNRDNKKLHSSEINHDILGYVDKDIESNYTRIDTEGNSYTIANIDIYPEIYTDDKEE